MSVEMHRTGEAVAPATVDTKRADFYHRARNTALAPLWTVLKGLVPKTLESPPKPMSWTYSHVRPYLLEACELLGTEEPKGAS